MAENEPAEIERSACQGEKEPDKGDPCDEIQDSLRRMLCKTCGVPVVGEAPWCKDHKPPIP